MISDRRGGLRLKMVLSIILPGFICFSVFAYYMMSNLAKVYINSDAAAKVMLQGIVIFVSCLVILLIAVLFTTSSIIKPVRKLITYSESLSSGNTDFKVDFTRRKDEIGQLSRSIREAQLSLKKVTLILDRASGDILKGNLSVRADASYYPGDFGRIMDNNNKVNDTICDIIRNIRDSATSVASAAQQISAGSQNLSQGSTEQAAAIQEISATVSEILHRTKISSDNAIATKELSEKVNSEARAGSEKMEQLISALEDINSASSHISNVIKVIEDIAFQTNILALNAAVEAARAGIHGKGFAVVAGEVKNLADKSAKAAKETGDLLSGSISKSKYGLKIGEDMEKTLGSIMDGILRSVDSIAEIAGDCLQQVDTIAQLNTGLSQVSQVVQSNTATAQEAAASSQEMSAQSTDMMAMVSHFAIDVQRIVAKPSGFNEEDY
ncbi:MAG: methyl-accepting chemotaxis protein [Clostridiales bacterium]|nr:methyl-accepting chemotaxis protein [Clostridiales bacterium]